MGLSKTSVSTGMRTLQDLKMIHKVWNRGSRKDLYEVETDWYQTFADYFSIKWRKSVEMNRHALERSLREMNQLLKEHPDNETLVNILRSDIEKIRAAIQYYDWLNRLIDTFESGQSSNSYRSKRPKKIISSNKQQSAKKRTRPGPLPIFTFMMKRILFFNTAKGHTLNEVLLQERIDHDDRHTRHDRHRCADRRRCNVGPPPSACEKASAGIGLAHTG